MKSPVFAVLLLLAPALPAQTATRSVTRQPSLALKPYTTCKLPGGPELMQTTALPQVPMSRAAQTLTGPQKITIADGLLAAFGFRTGIPFANVKVEQLPAATYARQKPELISEFDAINAKGEDTQRNYDLKPTLNGFEVYGFDRTALDGNVLGIYLLFDNVHHVATTAYFLNAPADQRQFSTVQQYVALREAFLNEYTTCVRKQLGGTAVSTKKATAKSPAKRKTRH